jgi:hypothetical protein
MIDLHNLISGDMTLLIYGIEAAVCFLAFILFAWWGIYKFIVGNCKPTNVYILVMLLFLTMGYATMLGVIARLVRGGGDVDAYVKFMQGLWWHTRILPRLIIESMILWRMSRRVYINFFKVDRRRHGDRDGDDV